MLEFPKFQIYNKKTDTTEELTQINFETKSIVTNKCNCYMFDDKNIILLQTFEQKL